MRSRRAGRDGRRDGGVQSPHAVAGHINISASGTRKEERLYSKEEIQRLSNMRRMLADMKPAEAKEKLYAIYDREGIEYQAVFDSFLEMHLGHIDSGRPCPAHQSPEA